MSISKSNEQIFFTHSPFFLLLLPLQAFVSAAKLLSAACSGVNSSVPESFQSPETKKQALTALIREQCYSLIPQARYT